MFEYIEGILKYKNLNYIVIDINGLGYSIEVPFTVYEKLPEINEKCKVFIHTVITEKSVSFYGFNEKIEKEIFEKMLTIPNIGAKIGLSILSTYTYLELLEIVYNEDFGKITKVKGLGKSKATILVSTIKSKFDKIIEKNSIDINKIDNDIKVYSIRNDLLMGLESLGYTSVDLNKVITNEEINEINNLSVLMKEVLKRLSSLK